MARLLSAAGFSTVCCTAHLIKGNFDADNATVKAAVAALQLELDRERIALQLLPGREYYFDEYLPQLLSDPLTLGETQLLLIEIPNHTPVEFVKKTCYQIRRNGYIPLIAHPERCKLLASQLDNKTRKNSWSSLFSSKLKTDNSKLKTQNSELLSYLQEIGCKFQGNIGSFAGVYGEKVKDQAETFLEQGVYDLFGSDAHRAAQLKDILRRGRQAINLVESKLDAS